MRKLSKAISACALICLLGAGSSFGQQPQQSQAASPAILLLATAASPWQELRQVGDTLNGPHNGHPANCNLPEPYFPKSTTVADFIGGRVAVIRIVRFALGTNSSLTREELPRLLGSVWTGKFNSASCHIDWDEGVEWSIEAEVQFDDGTRAALLTDGSHVALQDSAGKSGFLRLLPAAQ